MSKTPKLGQSSQKIIGTPAEVTTPKPVNVAESKLKVDPEQDLPSVVLVRGEPKADATLARIERSPFFTQLYGTPDLLKEDSVLATTVGLLVNEMQRRGGTAGGKVDPDVKKTHQAGFAKALAGPGDVAKSPEIQKQTAELVDAVMRYLGSS